jgi:hypothetical protein
MEQEIYRVNDFCVRYAISRRSFYREIKADRLRVIKRGRRTYVARSDAESWLQNQHQAFELCQSAKGSRSCLAISVFAKGTVNCSE